MNEKTINGMHKPQLVSLLKETIEDINKINDAVDQIEKVKSQVRDSRTEISGDQINGGILGEVRGMQVEASKKMELIRDIYTDLDGIDEDESDNGIKGDLENLQKDFYATQEKLKSAERELYGYEEKTEEGEEKHIDGLTEKIINFFEVQKKKYSETYDKIENELLSGATTVSLSKAYTDKADSYKKPNIIWLCGFLISIIAIISILLYSLTDVRSIFFSKTSADSAAKLIDVQILLNSAKLIEYLIIKLIINIGIISSLIWVASFTGKRYSQNKRLSEEYSYKATFAKSFEGYRKRAEELDEQNNNRELSEKLMNKMIEISAFNPVDTMESKSHKENHPSMKVLEKTIGTLEKSVGIIDKVKN